MLTVKRISRVFAIKAALHDMLTTVGSRNNTVGRVAYRIVRRFVCLSWSPRGQFVGLTREGGGVGGATTVMGGA